MMERPFPSVAQSDIILLFGSMRPSLLPASVAEIHLYIYLANLIALNNGLSMDEWGYPFAVTQEGFPFSEPLNFALNNLVDRSILITNGRELRPSNKIFQFEHELMASLKESNRRQDWLETAALCVLNLPSGAVRGAINVSPGVFMALRDHRVTSLLNKIDLDLIYKEFDVVRNVLGGDASDLLRPAVLWLSARILAGR